jgi:addiction module RelB/DinJ family antitoxin
LGYDRAWATNAVVRSRINAEVKEKATAVLEEMGLTVSDAMRIVLTRMAKEEALPFDLKPNKLTRETMRKTAHGRGLTTCLALRIERDGSAALANAGHLPPYLNGKELAIEGALPLGAIAGIEFPLLHFKLGEADTLVLMTDGVAEAQDAEGYLFGFDRIAEMLRKGTAASSLANTAQAFGQEDDITVLMVARMATVAA